MNFISNTKSFKLNNTVACFGNFDGIHLGHQKLINTTIDYAKKENFNSVVFSFYPHPKKILFSEQIQYILTPQEKKFVLEKMGLDVYVEYPFDLEFSKLSPTQFFEDIIVNMLNCKKIIVGENYRFGNKKKGDTYLLAQLCKKNNIQMIIVNHLNYAQSKISSSSIRNYIKLNNFKLVSNLTGRPYFIKDIVEEGNKIGRTINFPTANFYIKKDKLLPNDGIYITKCTYDNKTYNSITNIGNNPTLKRTRKTIETYIFDFDEMIYSKEIIISFYKKIRDEMTFKNLDQLKDQIQKDVEETKKYFN